MPAAGHPPAAPKSRRMRNRALHDALRNFALEAAALLTDELKGGAEVEFDVVDEGGGRGPALYRYEPRTGAFIEERWPRLRELPVARGGVPRARRRRLGVAARERAARRAGRARAARDARAAVRGRDQLRLPRGALRARVRRGRADAVPRCRPRARDRAAARRVDARRARGAGRRPLARARRRDGGPARPHLASVRARARRARRRPDPGRRGGRALRLGRDGDAAVGSRAACRSSRPAGASPTRRAGSRCRSARAPGRAAASGCCRPATSRRSASSSRRSASPSARRTWRGRSTASRWAPPRRRTPRR